MCFDVIRCLSCSDRLHLAQRLLSIIIGTIIVMSPSSPLQTLRKKKLMSGLLLSNYYDKVLSTRKHQKWFNEADRELQKLLEKKRSCHNHLLAKPDDQDAKAAYKTVCSTL